MKSEKWKTEIETLTKSYLETVLRQFNLMCDKEKMLLLSSESSPPLALLLPLLLLPLLLLLRIESAASSTSSVFFFVFSFSMSQLLLWFECFNLPGSPFDLSWAARVALFLTDCKRFAQFHLYFNLKINNLWFILF